MDAYTVQKLKHSLNSEVVRRLLIKYFINKGFTESFDRLIYPAMLQDMPYVIPELYTKLEIEPYASNIDPMTDSAKIGWNLFVLGEQRMFLGETYHTGLNRLAQMIKTQSVVSENSDATRQTTPRRVVHFVTNVLKRVEAGYTDLTPKIVPNFDRMYGSRLGSNMGAAQQFFTRSGYGA